MKLLWAVHPLQGLAESLAVGLLILGATASLEGYVDWFVFQAVLFFLCGTCGMWAVLRIRLPELNWRRQIMWETGMAMALSAVMVFGVHGLGDWLGWNAAWRLSTWDSLPIYELLICTGVGYLPARLGVRLWLRWDQMRQQRMIWSLTHAHLTVVVFFALLAALGLFLLTPYSGTAWRISENAENPVASIVSSLLISFFPAFVLVTVLTAMALAALLPPLAVFSYFVARRTTRRLEALAAATAALRAGDYRARVAVDGEDEVARLQADYNAMAERLETTLEALKTERDAVARLLQSRRDLMAGVSHELRTPVATMRAAIETTLERWEQTPAEEVRQKLSVMDNEIQRLSGLIDDLFSLSQAEVGALALACAKTDLSTPIRAVVDAFAPLAWNSGRVEAAVDLPDRLPPALADERRLQQALLNLLRNAARYTPPGGIIVVSAQDEPETVCLQVRDTGAGIAPEDLPHIWERFYRGRVPGGQQTGDGAGLGLALVKEMVEAMGGTVGVESTPGQGSCFTIRLKKATAL